MKSRLKELREVAGLTQQELADKAGLSVSMISQMEKGTKKLMSDSFHSVLKALNITIEDFFSIHTREEIEVCRQVLRIMQSDRFYAKNYLIVNLRALTTLIEIPHQDNVIQSLESISQTLIHRLDLIIKKKK